MRATRRAAWSRGWSPRPTSSGSTACCGAASSCWCRPSARTLIDFCYHLGLVLESGIPLLEGLRDLTEQGSSPIARQIEDLVRKVESGQLLSEAMAAYPELFPDLVRALVAAGEESGKLDAILRDLAAHLEWREDLRRQVVGAATYPCIVMVGLVGLLVLMGTVVLPRFLEVFVELGVELPFATRALLATQGFLASHWLLLLLGSAAASVALWMYVRTDEGRHRLDALSLRAPILGRILTMIEASRLSHNLGLLHASGIAIVRSLEMIEKIIQNRVLRGLIAEARELVARGETLTKGLGRDDVLPPLVLRMVSLGETTGRLEESLEHVARYYDREVPAAIDGAITAFNTIAVVLLGVVLGGVTLSLFVPLYQMLGNLNA